jgi:4,5-DOPA dioxygenase extradiol
MTHPTPPGSVPPSLFVSHGPPNMVLDEIPLRGVLAELGRTLPRPKAILCVSAHWVSERPTASLAARPETIHDFFGFDPALYEIRYPAPGAPEVARRAVALLAAAGIEADLDLDRGLDHGAWEPLMLMYPAGDVPVSQLSLPPWPAAELIRMGRALAPLRDEGVLLLASGTAVHNLQQWRSEPVGTPEWARSFEDWLVAAVSAGDGAAIGDYLRRAPAARRAHPTAEHFLPLPLALGAGGAGATGRVLHRGFSYGSLSMATFAFEAAV